MGHGAAGIALHFIKAGHSMVNLEDKYT